MTIVQSERKMKWKAIHSDGLILKELDNSFEQINKETLERFLLEGMDTRFTHEVKTGQFSINSTNFALLLNDRLIGRSSDVINFKGKVIAFDSGQDAGITEYLTGWKEQNEDFNYIEPIFVVDMLEQKILLRLSITPKVEGTAIFTIIANGKMVHNEIEFENLDRHTFVYELY